jgi:hypothetical protein
MGRFPVRCKYPVVAPTASSYLCLQCFLLLPFAIGILVYFRATLRKLQFLYINKTSSEIDAVSSDELGLFYDPAFRPLSGVIPSEL